MLRKKQKGVVTMVKPYRNSIPRRERIILGCKANSGKSISELARQHETNRQFVYDQQEKVMEVLECSFDICPQQIPSLVLSNEMLEKIVFGCMVICKGSTEDTQEFFEQVVGIHVATGKISSIINRIAEKAEQFNRSIPLGQIKAGAHDEIFQAGKPVLVGVDVYSTYIYLMKASDTRDATDWGVALLEKVDNGLSLESSVNDAATGLKKGVTDVFVGINMQSDVFHAEHKVGLGISNLERAAYKAIRRDYDLERKWLKTCGKNKDKYYDEYLQAHGKAAKAVEIYDKANILYEWIRESFQIGGASYEERIYAMEYAVRELGGLEHSNAYLNDGIKYLSDHKQGLLQFVESAYKQMKIISEQTGVSEDILHWMWEQKKYSVESQQYNIMEVQIGTSLMGQYEYIHKKFHEMMDKVVRASSIVECINSLIRPYLFLKRTVNGKFLDLLQFYFNTRKYKRSRHNERIGRSPLELLMGKEYQQPLGILGY
jgi:hypothetical protein